LGFAEKGLSVCDVCLRLLDERLAHQDRLVEDKVAFGRLMTVYGALVKVLPPPPCENGSIMGVPTSSSSSSSVGRGLVRNSVLRRKEFTAKVVRNRPEPIQRDLFDIDAGHTKDGVAHDAVDGVLVPHFVGPGSERVAEGVKADAPAFQAKFGQERPKPIPCVASLCRYCWKSPGRRSDMSLPVPTNCVKLSRTVRQFSNHWNPISFDSARRIWKVR
jgi:hypothetical protein